MPSSFTWLDYSERDRRRALDVVDLFRESGTLDELGVGAIRDSFSDLFFPGTSTIQTRACYFLIIPWTFLRLERLRIASAEAEERARREELLLNERLCRGEDTAGVFGGLAGRALKRLPSQVYWSGLRSWGIRLFPGYASAYFRSLDGFYRKDRNRGDAERPGGTAGFAGELAPAPARPAGLLSRHGVGRTSPARRRVPLRSNPGPPRGKPARRPRQPGGAGRPRREVALGPGGHRRHLTGPSAPARRRTRFAIILHGAALLYNLMLAEAKADRERIDGYRAQLESWAVDVDRLGSELDDWDLEGVWSVTRDEGRAAGPATRSFVEHWVDGVRTERPRAVVREGAPARRLIRDREVRLKKGRARLANLRQLELWGGASGTSRMDFRWGPVQGVLRDVFDGLRRDTGDAPDA